MKVASKRQLENEKGGDVIKIATDQSISLNTDK